MRSLMVDLVPLFERASGEKVEIEFRLTSVLQKEIEEGAVFDIALLPRPELDALAQAGRIAAGSDRRHNALVGRTCGARGRAQAGYRYRRSSQADVA